MKECFNEVFYIEKGPAVHLDEKLEVNEFDMKSRSHLNISDSIGFKMMIMSLV